VRLDWEIAKRGWRRYAVYPWATVAGIFTNTIFGFIQAYVLLAMFEHRADVGGYDARDTVTYVWLGQALLMTVYSFGWQEFAWRIRDGSIATDLSRPLDPQRYWLAIDLGRAPFHLIYRGVLPFVFGALVFSLHYPSALDLLAFVISLALAVVVSFGFRFLYNTAAFWLTDIRGVVTLAITLSVFLSGLTVPVPFFPGWLRTIAQALPFASILQTPIDFWLGKHEGAELALFLGLQVFWAAALLALGRLALRAGARRLVVQGG
jgi:ABC-2 type transport system permease protein